MRRTIVIISSILIIVMGLAISSYVLLLNKQKAVHETDQKTAEIIIEYWTTPLYGGVIGGDGYGEWEQSLIAEFQQNHPNVKINFQIIPSSAIEQKVMVAALRNGLPDILLDGLDRRIMKYLQFGKNEDISDFFDDDLDDYTQIALDIVSRDGKIYGIPTTYKEIAMYVNRHIFREKGLEHLLPVDRDWTMDEWEDAMRQVSGDGVYGTAIHAGSEQSDEMPLLYFFGNGVEMWDKDSEKIVLDQYIDEAVETIEMFKRMERDGAIAPGAGTLKSEDAVNMFMQGRVAMLAWGQGIHNVVEEGKLNGSINKDIELFGIAPVHKEGQVSRWAFSLHGYIVFEQKNQEKREMIKKFLKFMTNTEHTRMMAMASGSNPVRLSSHFDLEEGERMEVSQLLEKLPNLNLGTSSPYYADVRLLWYPHLQAALLGDLTPEEAVLQFTEKANQLIEERSKK